MEHANAGAVRAFLTAWFQGDEDGWRPLATEDVVIHMRRRSDGAPVHVDIQDVFADDRFAVAIVHVAYQHSEGNTALTYACAQRIDETGRISKVWNLPDDQAAEDSLFLGDGGPVQT